MWLLLLCCVGGGACLSHCGHSAGAIGQGRGGQQQDLRGILPLLQELRWLRKLECQSGVVVTVVYKSCVTLLDNFPFFGSK